MHRGTAGGVRPCDPVLGGVNTVAAGLGSESHFVVRFHRFILSLLLVASHTKCNSMGGKNHIGSKGGRSFGVVLRVVIKISSLEKIGLDLDL